MSHLLLTFFENIILLHAFSKCNNYDLKVGSTIMGNKAIADTQGRTMIVTRNGLPLSSGAAFVAGETLTVYVSSFSKEAIYQTTGAATFASGYSCTNANGSPNNRVAATSSQYLGINLDSSGHYSASLVMPQAGSGSVTVFAAMASGFTAVSIIPSFVLTDPGVVQSSLKPSNKPVASPSPKPFTPSFKPNLPTTSPSSKQNAPSESPTAPIPSLVPSVRPSDPSVEPSVEPTAILPKRPTRSKKTKKPTRPRKTYSPNCFFPFCF